MIDEFTGEYCDVTPYSNDYKPMTDVPIVNASTTYTDSHTGETIILRFNQVLWYGKKMHMSLINPNQMRHGGLAVSDDPTDYNRVFGITGDDFVIPFEIVGTTVFFTSHVPTRWELDNCRVVEMTLDSPWNPAEVHIRGVRIAKSTDLEHRTLREVCALANIPRCSSGKHCHCCDSDMSVFHDATMITKMVGADRHSRVNPETVAKRFRCGIETAQKTLKATTQRGIRQAMHPLNRRYRVDHLNLNRRRLNDTFYMDTLFSKVKSLAGHTCAQLITNGTFTRVYPMETKASANIAAALTEFIDDVGIPYTLVCDLATEQTGKNTEVMKLIRRMHIKLRMAEKGRGITQNHRAEAEIREVKTKWKARMRSNQIPSRLWDYGLVYIAEIQSLLARGADHRPGLERVTGHTVDISDWLDFDIFERVWYWNQRKMDMTDEQACIGHWLACRSHCVLGSDMTYWILTESGKVIARSTVQHITVADMATDEMQARVRTFDSNLADRLNDDTFTVFSPDHAFYLQDDDDGDPPRNPHSIPPDAEYGDMMQNDKLEADDTDNGETVPAKVVKRARDIDGNPIGRRQAVLQEITDHRRDKTAIHITNGYTTTKRGRRIPKTTTKGWQLSCQWRNGTSDWVALKHLKDSNPIQLAEYAVANRLQEEPAFKWWVSNTLRTRNRIIAKVKRRYWMTNYKYGIRLPHSVQEALQINKETGTDFWWQAIQKEMKKVMVAFEYDDQVTPEQVRNDPDKYVGFQEIKCHMIFDVKMDLTRKARFVAGGHMTEPPPSITYSCVVSRDSVRLAFLIAALNDLDITACDVGNAYLNAPCREKIWFVAGPEFGSRQGTVIKVVRALYGLKSSGAAWRSMFNSTILEMGFAPTIADPDVYRRRANAKPDGFKYYEYILVYVDDVLIISHDTDSHLKRIQASYDLNPDSIGPPTRYLGADVRRLTRPGDTSGREYWSLSAPEIDMSDECDDDEAARFSQLIGVLRWAVELGRIDIYTEVALLLQHLALPRVGHLEAVYHIFAYLSKHEKSSIIFDPTDPLPHTITNAKPDWTPFYSDAEELLPPKMPEPLGHPVNIYTFVDANHAGNVVTRRSHTGILLFVQNSPILWLSRRQNTVETSTFGSEFVASRTARDMIIAMRYKLRMFGVPLEGPAQVFCDNQGVVKNASVPESVLTKKHNAVNYHAVREAAAAGVMEVHKEDTATKLADLLTKVLPSDRRRELLGTILYNL
ncbi:Reverse transcriptase (RNA-dependent DNA polymerase) [Fragilaria crotonensis]|nr:Reverse transcriptase (RNA-dependent DNA polymerase) [Fragilaria crotonensis]